MAEQSAARLEGDRYQHLYSWYELLRLLDEDSPYEYGYVEHPDAGSADDVTLHPKADSNKPARYIQIKWHVDQRDTYSFTNLTEVLSGTRSLLHKLFDSWKELKKNGAVEVWLVSNWSSAPELGRFLRARDNNFSDDFFTCTSRSQAGRARTNWMKQLGATEQELLEFCRDLRLRLGFAGIGDFEEMVDERMGRYGLRMGPDARAKAIDEVRHWIEIGGNKKRVTREVLLDVIHRRELRAAAIDIPAVSLWIHGWGKMAFDRPPSIELDWTSHFDRATRTIPGQAVWYHDLFPQLQRATEKLLAQPNGTYVDFRGKLPLTAVLAVGAKLSEVAGFKLRAQQPTRGETFLWRSDVPISERTFQTREETYDGEGQDILIAFCITGEALTDVRTLAAELAGQLKALVYAEPDNGTGDAAVTNNADAVALAVRAKEVIREMRNRYRANQIHLVLYAPATFCLFLGQRLNAVGNVTTYERTAAGGYQCSVIIPTG
jgi:hypothetical protein